MSHRINDNVDIRACPAVEKCLGLFASHRMSKGLKILSEVSLLVDYSRVDMVADVGENFSALSLDQQALFTRLYAGPLDVVPLMTTADERHERGRRSVEEVRLRQIVQLNSVEGAGTGCVLSPAVAIINHDCRPNAYVYYNWLNNSVTVHALRDIEPNEEVTVSYLQSNFDCRCDICSPTSALRGPSDVRRNRTRELRDELGRYHQLESPAQEETVAAIASLRELIQVMDHEGIIDIELSLRLAEQARLQEILGNADGMRIAHARAMIVRRLCAGADHPSCQ